VSIHFLRHYVFGIFNHFHSNTILWFFYQSIDQCLGKLREIEMEVINLNVTIKGFLWTVDLLFFCPCIHKILSFRVLNFCAPFMLRNKSLTLPPPRALLIIWATHKSFVKNLSKFYIGLNRYVWPQYIWPEIIWPQHFGKGRSFFLYEWRVHRGGTTVLSSSRHLAHGFSCKNLEQNKIQIFLYSTIFNIICGAEKA
jgi:hypothetical protein